MRRRMICGHFWAVIAAFSCFGGTVAPEGEPSRDGPGDSDFDAEPASPEDAAVARTDQGPEAWVFDRDAYETVHGWILLDPDPEAVRRNLLAAAGYGVNHIQLSHGLVMSIEDLLGDSPEVLTRVQVLNQAIAQAHALGMKAYIWAHEFSGTGIDVCYAPDSAVWENRANAYRTGLARIPEVDGVVLMFGSAPMPPWATACLCAWCLVTGEENPFDTPPLFSPIFVVSLSSSQATLAFSTRRDARVFVDYGTEIPDYGQSVDAGLVTAGSDAWLL